MLPFRHLSPVNFVKTVEFLQKLHGEPMPIEEIPVPEAQNTDPIVEALAAYAHKSWAGWMKWLFSKGQMHPFLYVWCMETAWRERWLRQMNTPYADLPEQEKESDRKEAREILDILSARHSQDDVVLLRECYVWLEADYPSELFPTPEGFDRSGAVYAIELRERLRRRLEGQTDGEVPG